MAAAVSPVFLKTCVCVLTSVHRLLSRGQTVTKVFHIRHG